MRLILFRHGIAEDQRAGLDDADRRLTPAGIERTRLAARGLAELYGPVDAVLTSPKARALQTAEVLCEILGKHPMVCEPLAHGNTDAITALLGERDDNVLVMVGHEPTLSGLAELLCVGSSPYFIELKKAGAIVLRIESLQPGRASAMLEALLPPRALRAVGGEV